MGVEGLGNLVNGEDESAPETVAATRPTDQEVYDKQQADRDAAREEHNRRTGGGKYHPDHPEYVAPEAQ